MRFAVFRRAHIRRDRHALGVKSSCQYFTSRCGKMLTKQSPRIFASEKFSLLMQAENGRNLAYSL